ncbi:MAG: biopolymer transporter ExbD [Alphaproteobacteria bacterium]|jgi:biopolymer transport protein TolR|nr:biopolymer transporter ExbD [Alphaproteobacteria bacterium]
MRHKKNRIISEINVTPFVDVLLVILIIFMVTAPMMNMGFDVSLPKSSPNLTADLGNKKVVISVDKKNNVYVNDKKTTFKNLNSVMKSYSADSQIFIKADKDVVYQQVISIMSSLNKIGFSNISLVTEVDN